jgi:hypothetical protein
MKLFLKVSFVLFLLMFFVGKSADAANLLSASSTVTTSRPSPSSPIQTDANAGVGQLLIFNNSSRYLASDSAKILRGTGIVSNIETIASQSGTLTAVYLADTLGTGAGAGADVLFVPITAMHTVRFTTATTIPIGGTIVISYPGSGNNTASPSATTFAFNNLNTTASTNVQTTFSSGTTTCTFIATAPTITCTVGVDAIDAGTSVNIFIGCSAASGLSCTTQVPTIINPTKSIQTAGSADIWKVDLTTTDGAVNLDNATLVIGTIESVTVRANIDPSLTFTITGITNGNGVNNGNTTGCLEAELTNTGINSTATEVNLGTLSNTPTTSNTMVSNVSAQLITITTNAANGYVLTATSSGHLRNPSTGYFLTDATTPQVFPSTGANFYGFHGCGLDTYNSDIGTTFWNSSASDTNCNTYISGSGGNICKYGWPTANSPITIASDTSGPIGNSLLAGNGLTSVSYAAGADAGVPPGQYTTVVTYVATPAF